ncbi:MAG: hypothetical protein WEA54_06450 [Actinomycetota bacterium]
MIARSSLVLVVLAVFVGGCGTGGSEPAASTSPAVSTPASPSASSPAEPTQSDDPDPTTSPTASPNASEAPLPVPEITRFDAPSRLACNDPVSELITIRYRVVRADEVRFDLDGADLSSRGFPNKGSAQFDLPCDGENHRLTLLAFVAGSDDVAAQASRIVRAPR